MVYGNFIVFLSKKINFLQFLKMFKILKLIYQTYIIEVLVEIRNIFLVMKIVHVIQQ